MRLRGTRAYAAPDMTRIAAILPAAGMGTRMGAETPKQFLELNGTPIVILSLRRIASCTLVTDLIVATRADEIQRLEERIAKEKLKQPVRVVKGGDSRQDSVAAALREVPNEAEIVLVHDAGLVERLGRDVHVVLGSERNMKITKPADMELARFYLDCEIQKA